MGPALGGPPTLGEHPTQHLSATLPARRTHLTNPTNAYAEAQAVSCTAAAVAPFQSSASSQIASPECSPRTTPVPSLGQQQQQPAPGEQQHAPAPLVSRTHSAPTASALALLSNLRLLSEGPHHHIHSRLHQPPASPPPDVRQLPTSLVLHVLSFLPPNILAHDGRRVCRDAAKRFSSSSSSSSPSPSHCIILLSQPLSTASLQQGMASSLKLAVHGMPLRRRQRLFSTAAASGCDTNLELVSTLSGVVPGRWLLSDPGPGIDPGSAAVRAGHLHLLPWLLGKGLLSPQATLAAAARYCSLRGLQDAWEQLSRRAAGTDTCRIDTRVLLAAAASGSCDSVAKAQWLLSLGEATSTTKPQLLLSYAPALAAAAAGAGDLVLLQWLHTQRPLFGCSITTSKVNSNTSHAPGAGFSMTRVTGEEEEEEGEEAEGPGLWCDDPGERQAGWDSCRLGQQLAPLVRALESPRAGLEVVEWLVDTAGCPLGAVAEGSERATGCGGGDARDAAAELWRAAGASGSCEKLDWLLRRGLHSCCEAGARAAARGGHAAAVRFLLDACGVALSAELFCEAAASGSVGLAGWLLQQGCPMPCPSASQWRCAYVSAAAAGSVEMVRWLVQEAGCPWGPNTWCEVVQEWPVTHAPREPSCGSSNGGDRSWVGAGVGGAGTSCGSISCHGSGGGDGCAGGGGSGGGVGGSGEGSGGGEGGGEGGGASRHSLCSESASGGSGATTAVCGAGARAGAPRGAGHSATVWGSSACGCVPLGGSWGCGAARGQPGSAGGSSSSSSSSGCVDALRLLHRAGCKPGVLANRLALQAALRAGDLPCVRFLHEELGAGLADVSVTEAAGGGCAALLEWLAARGCPFEGDAYLEAAGNCDVYSLGKLRRLRVACHRNTLQRVVRLGAPVEVVRWLVTHGSVGRGSREAREACEAAKGAGCDEEVVGWLEGLAGRGGGVRGLLGLLGGVLGACGRPVAV